MNPDKVVVSSDGISLRSSALVAGIGLLAMAILAAVANFSVLESLVVPGDAQATAANIHGATETFLMGLFFFIIVAILDVIVAWALYILFKSANTSLSLLAAWFRIVYSAVFALSLAWLFLALYHFTGSVNPDTNQLYAQGMASLIAFRFGWDIGLMIFGLHLVVLGYLVFRSGYMVRWAGILFYFLLVIAGLGYIFDSSVKFLIPDGTVTVSQFTFIGEVLLMFWLLWKGIKGLESAQT